MSDQEFLARAAEIINQTADMLKADNDHGYCTSCNRKANAERVNEIIRVQLYRDSGKQKGNEMELTLADGYILTTERAESSYGQPVLVGPSGRAYGPDDTPSEPSGDDVMDYFTESARQACASRALEIGLLAHPLVRKFLA